jgi:hypothetical protein
MNRNPYRTFTGGRKSLIKGLVICFGLLVLMVLSIINKIRELQNTRIPRDLDDPQL